MLRPERPVQHVATLVDENMVIWQPPRIVAQVWSVVERVIGLFTGGCPMRVKRIRLVRR